MNLDPDPLHVDEPELRRRPRPDGVPGPALVLAIVGIPLLLLVVIALVWMEVPHG